jgi:hypothetical protein
MKELSILFYAPIRMTDWDTTYKEPVRWAMVGSLLYATYLVAKCPCRLPASCSKNKFYAATLLPVIITVALHQNPAV